MYLTSVFLVGADSCDWDQFDRPIGGNVDFCYGSFDLEENGEPLPKVKQILIEVAIHEIGHVRLDPSESCCIRNREIYVHYEFSHCCIFLFVRRC